MAEIKKTGAAATSKSALNTKTGRISSNKTTTTTVGYAPIIDSKERYDPDIEDRKELGKTPLELYTDYLPENCEDCIFYVKNSMKKRKQDVNINNSCMKKILNLILFMKK